MRLFDPPQVFHAPLRFAAPLNFRQGTRKARFVHPLNPPPRTAILVPGFRTTRLARVFTTWQAEDIEQFHPAVIAGTFSQLMNVAQAAARVTHALVPLAWDPSELLTPEKRELLWDSFGVPIFEQYLGPGNVLLASECEAHSSLHATADYSGPLAYGKCSCGSEAPRLPENWSGLVRKPPAKATARAGLAEAARVG